MVQRVVSWVTTIPLLLSIAAVHFVFDPILRISRWIGRSAFEGAMVQLQVWLCRSFRLVALRVDVETTEQLDPSRAYLFVSNHQSNFDIPLLGATLKAHHCKYVANSNIARWIPSVSYSLRKGGHALVTRSQPRESARNVRDMARLAVERGYGVVIFPEGTRARDGVMLPFRELGATTLFNAAPDAPIVPVAIDGASDLMKDALWPTPFRHTVRLWVGDPIARRPGEDHREVLAEVRRRVEEKITSWRRAAVDA